MDIGAWLRGLGLERYQKTFRDNHIDAETLPELKEADLEKLGITSLGHRKRLLKAIATLSQTEAPDARPPPSADLQGATTTGPLEVRQITVLFCDLVDSTELARRFDPEDMRELIRSSQRAVARESARYDGQVARLMGNGVLVYFGYPRAHENDAERAVRAGLAMVERMAGLKAPDGGALAARAGIATGLVVVGNQTGEGAPQEQLVIGETPNLAAGIQAVTDPGAVAISAETRRLVGSLFELEAPRTHELKGFPEPVTCWRVLGAGRGGSRFEALHGSIVLTPLVGRDEEIRLLRRRWMEAKDGEGQVVLLSGEPGIGKSRIARSLIESLVDERLLRLRYQCSPFHSQSPLYPVLEQMAHAAGIKQDDPPETQLGKLEEVLRLGTEQTDEAVSLLAPLLSIRAGGQFQAATQAGAERQRQRTAEVLVTQVEGLAARQPLLMIVEDVQWSDPSTSELINLVIERIERLPVLLLITHRADFDPPWKARHVTKLSLARLGHRQVAAMVERISGGKTLPAEVLEHILRRTDGVPLFVEELSKVVLESQLLADKGDHYELTGPLPPLAIPATLHDSLMARLDRLAPVKEVAQAAAVIGREFSHRLLAAILQRPDSELDAAIDQLVAAGLIFRRSMPPDASYLFKHALVQEVAQQSLLSSRRQQTHAAVAHALEQHFPHTRDDSPEILAHHFTEAGLLEPAINYWEAAGRKAAQHAAHREASAHLTRALHLLQELPPGQDRQSRELALLTALGPSLLAVMGFADQAVAETYQRARLLCEELDDTAQLVIVLRGLWAFHLVRAELETSREIALQLQELATLKRNVAYEVEAQRPLGQSLFYLGDFTAARDHFSRTLQLYDPEEHGSHVYRYGSDSRVIATSYEGWTLWFLGWPDQAIARAEEAVAMARALGHPFTLSQTLADALYLYPLRGEIERTRVAAKEAIAYADEYGFPYWSAIGTVHLGWAMALTGELEAGLKCLSDGLAAYRRNGAALALPWFFGMLAEAQKTAGQAEVALATLDKALTLGERTGERFYIAELHRLRGAILAQTGGEPEPSLTRALTVAREQRARGLELRVAISLGRLWRDRGRRAEALDLLKPIYSGFTEGFETADLRAAGKLLEELSEP